jgi:hypothetical protein
VFRTMYRDVLYAFEPNLVVDVITGHSPYVIFRIRDTETSQLHHGRSV